MVKINGETWRIFIVSPNHPKLRRSNGEYALGSCDDIAKGVYIVEGLDIRKFKKVLCHELTHAAMYSYNVDLTVEQEELLADLIATYGQEIITETNRIFIRIKRDGLI